MVVSRARVASNDQKHITIPKDASTDSWGLPVPDQKYLSTDHQLSIISNSK